MFPTLSFRLRSTLSRAAALLALAAATDVSAQITLNVGPGQTYTTIQSGINAANAGDTVLVAPGTYYENIDFKGKAITVTTSGGSAVTTIDGGGIGPAVTFINEEPRTAVLSQFTITHGGTLNNPGSTTYAGPGILIADSAPTILNNVVTKNYCQNIRASFAAPLIQNNVVSFSLNPENCDVGTTGGINIGGVYNSPGNGAPLSPVIVGNTIENNTTGQLGDGGGDGGPGIWIDAVVNLAIVSNIIRNNATLTGNGGAILTANAYPVAIINNLIYGNTAGCGGGAIAFDARNSGSPYGFLIANNTLVDNTGFRVGGYSNCTPISQIYPNPGSYGYSDPSSAIINNIISGSTTYPAVDCSQDSTPSESTQPTFQNNLLYNGGGPFFGPHCIDVSSEYNNIVTAPQFDSAATGNYHVPSPSPTIDSGVNSVIQNVLTMTGFTVSTDLDGNPRVQDATHRGTAIIDMGAYESAGAITGFTAETLNSSLNPSSYGGNVTFTAALSSTSETPTGSIQFKEGSTVLGVQVISASGTASYSTAALSVGTHSITAVYEPTGIFAATTAGLSQVVNGGVTTTTTLTSSGNPSTYAQHVTFTATVLSPPGHPTGSVTFSDGATQLATVGLDTSGVAEFTTSTLTANDLGTTMFHQINATYAPTDSYTASAALLQQFVTGLPTTTTLVVTPTTGTSSTTFTLSATVASAASSSTTVPTGEVVFYSSAQTNITGNEVGYAALVNGVATLNTTGFVGGSDYVVGIYFGDNIYASSTSNYFMLTVTGAAPAVTLTSSLNPAPALTPITFTAQISAGSGGSVVFNINGQNITTAPNAAGIATTTTSTLTQGAYPITATWFATTNALGTQASLTQIVTPPIATPDFSLTGTNIIFKVLHSGNGDLEIGSLNSFAGSITLTCNPPYPANYTCTLEHPSINLAAGQISLVGFTLNYTETASVRTRSKIVLASLFPFTLFSLILARRRRTALRAVVSLALLAILTTATTACGSDHFIPITTGTFPITFTATGTSQGTTTPITHTETINATIAP